MTIITKVDEEYLLELKNNIDSCKICHGTSLSCACYKTYFLEVSKISACIPSNYRQYTWESLKSSNIQASIKKIKPYIEKLDYYRKTGTGLYLYGGGGTGKTAVGCIVLIEAIKKGYPVYYTDIDEYLRRMFNDAFKHDKEDGEQNELMRDSDFLLIDNLGDDAQDSKGLKKAWMDELLRYRTDNRLPSIIVTRYDENELTKNHARWKSIFKEHFLPPIAFTGEDYRLSIRNDNAKKNKQRNQTTGKDVPKGK